ncbi:MAG: hypothetical protein WCI05_09475 [Myxococcales bacterium]
MTSTLLPHVYLLREGPAVHVTWRAPAAKEFQVGAMVCDHQLENRLRISG